MKNDKLQVIASMKIRPGKLEGFKQQAAEIIRLARERDTKTLRYDWFINKDQSDCEVCETYENSDGLIEHRMHINDALNKLFDEFAEDHAVTIFGNPSPQLVEMTKAHKEVKIKWYSFLKGLES